MPRDPNLITRAELAERLGCSVSTLAHGHGPPAARTPGKVVLYYWPAVVRWLTAEPDTSEPDTSEPAGGEPCSTSNAARASIGSNGGTTARRYASPQEREILRQLRSRAGAYGSSTRSITAPAVPGPAPALTNCKPPT